MNTVWCGHLVLEQETRGFHIGQNHALFNQLVCIVAIMGYQTDHGPALIKLKTVFGTFKSYRASFETCIV